MPLLAYRRKHSQTLALRKSSRLAPRAAPPHPGTPRRHGTATAAYSPGAFLHPSSLLSPRRCLTLSLVVPAMNDDSKWSRPSDFCDFSFSSSYLPRRWWLAWQVGCIMRGGVVRKVGNGKIPPNPSGGLAGGQVERHVRIVLRSPDHSSLSTVVGPAFELSNSQSKRRANEFPAPCVACSRGACMCAWARACSCACLCALSDKYLMSSKDVCLKSFSSRSNSAGKSISLA